MPSVSGDTYCPEDGDQGSSCGTTGSCKACTTFNQADIQHMKSQGWNSIRLGERSNLTLPWSDTNHMVYRRGSLGWSSTAG